MDTKHASPKFKVGDRVKVTSIGCDCPTDPIEIEYQGQCYRHRYLGAEATVTEVSMDDGCPCYAIDNDQFDCWYEDELEAVR